MMNLYASHRARVSQELPFMAMENILMEAVKLGGDRQDLHERIRGHAIAAAQQMKEAGGENDLLERIKADDAFREVRGLLDEILDPEKFIGRAPEQVDEFVAARIDPIRARYKGDLERKPGLEV